jgi:Protein NO VEIN, C-terminal
MASNERESPEERRPEQPRPTSSVKVANRGRLTDAKRQTAVEMYAVGSVMDLWGQDFEVEDVGLKESWDITATKGAREVHIEVKGSSGTRDAVDLTDGEVRHAEGNAETVLVVVDQIKVGSGNKCSGGRLRTWRHWVPDRSVLVSTTYRYPLPASPEQE